ncbi:transcription elongation factor spt5 [Dissophora globulifera]|uniref:Transcription elongation factor SPT5 n=1 Tax=Dissophora globulifera TaxID=979702 RepID=A0A9P6RV46_9FUNG|nr:transcription elongation factor spt5 [Dissophora globulifera]
MSRNDSDHDEDDEFENLGKSRSNDDDDDDSDQDDSPRRSSSNSKHSSSKHRNNSKRHDDDDDEDEEDDDDDEDDEEDEDEADTVSRRHKKQKRAVNPFLDMEAEVDDEDEDEEEDDDEYGAGDGFIADEHDEAAEATRASKHLDLDRRRREEDDVDLEEQAARLKERYGRRDYAPRRAFQGQQEDIPQQLLMPDVASPHLWMVRCKPGKEKDLVFSLMRKFFDTEYSAQPLEISAVFSREALKGYVYIECRRQANVQTALNGLNNVFASKLTLVPIGEMTDVLKVKHKESDMRPGTWVRVKRGKYAMDLAQILDIADSGDTAKVKLIPRLDMTPRLDAPLAGSNKRKPVNSVLAGRPPPKLFNAREAEKADKLNKPTSRGRGVFVWNNDVFRDGYLEKDMKISSLITENINPTLDEIQKFAKGGIDDEDGGLDLSAVALSAMGASVTSHFQPGEKVEVTEGELKHVHGVVDSVSSDMIMVRPLADDLKGNVLKFPPTQLRKLFKEGDHVKVVNGKFKDETGLIIKIEDSVVTIVTDLNVKDIQVFSKDLQMAANVSSGTGTIGQYETHDFVQLDASTVGVIYKVERGFARVLDQSGIAREVEPHLITQKRDSSRAIATDGEGNSIQDGDSVRELGGAMRDGKILHLFRTFAFLHNREYMENNGVFVQSTRLLVSMASKSRSQPGMRLDTMNPAMMNMNRGGFNGRGGRGGGMMMGRGRGGRDPLIDKTVTIIRGPHKGYLGIVKDATDSTARVELHTNCRIITVEKAKLAITNANGTTTPVSSMADMNPPSTPRAGGYGGYGGYGGMTPMRSGDMTPMHPSGSRTPAWNSGSRTPAWNAGSKTPAWSANSRTPNPYADGSQTPAWDAGSKTPRYGGSSAWDNGSRTPAHAWDAGSRTPARGSAWGDSDSGSGGPHGGGSGMSGGGYNAWNDKADSGTGAGGFPQTPAASGDWMNRSVPTPGPFGAPSPAPYSSYPYTPGPSSNYDSAPTPSSNNFPQTPAASSSLGSGSHAGSNGNSHAASVATPGATPGASNSRLQSIATPGAPQTPAGGPSAPMTPASHFPQTPFMPTGGDYSGMDSHGHGGQVPGYGSGVGGAGTAAGPSYDWVTIDIEVRISTGKDGSSFSDGKYNDRSGRTMKVPSINALSSMALCDVKLSSGADEGKVVQVPVQFLKAVAPQKNDGVKVLAGEHIGALGTLMGVDVQDGIVSLRGENMYKVLTMSMLGKYVGA